MYESTHRGAWFNWSALDAAEKRLMKMALGAFAVPWLVGLAEIAVAGYKFGRSLRPAERAAVGPEAIDLMGNSPLFQAMVLIAIVCTILGAMAWRQLGARQDELFRRVQSHALGRAGLCLLGATAFWWLLSLPGWVGAMPVGLFLYVDMLLVSFFSMQAWQRWG